MQLGVEGVDGLVWSLIRNLGVGSELVVSRNVWLAEQMVGLVEERRDWVVTQTHLLAGLVYALLRLVEDHSKTGGSATKDPR